VNSSSSSRKEKISYRHSCTADPISSYFLKP